MSEFFEVINAAAQNSPKTVATVGGSYAIVRVLGPTVRALGDVFGDATEYRLRNLLGLNEKIARRMQDASETDETAPEDPNLGVHPRVARTLLEEGSWIDNDLHQEYLAGLLMDARRGGPDSDAGAYHARVVTAMTADQILLHYLLMDAYAGHWANPTVDPNPFPHPLPEEHWSRNGVVVSIEELAGRFSHGIIDDPARALRREGILKTFGHLTAPHPLAGTHAGFVPTPFGADLFVRALTPDDRRRRLPAWPFLLPRDRLRSLFTYPDPEPEPLQTASIGPMSAY